MIGVKTIAAHAAMQLPINRSIAAVIIGIPNDIDNIRNGNTITIVAIEQYILMLVAILLIRSAILITMYCSL